MYGPLSQNTSLPPMAVLAEHHFCDVRRWVGSEDRGILEVGKESFVRCKHGLRIHREEVVDAAKKI